MVSFSFCGTSQTTCARYFSSSLYQSTYTTIASWNLSITIGYNKILLNQSLAVQKGYMFYLAQNLDAGRVALDLSGDALFGDIAWKIYIEELNPQSNYRFYLQPLTNFSSYQTEISIYHSYAQAGYYFVSLTFQSSNQIFMSLMKITNCKYNY